jgi:hypothetical protein
VVDGGAEELDEESVTLRFFLPDEEVAESDEEVGGGGGLCLELELFSCPPEGGLGSSWLKHASKQSWSFLLYQQHACYRLDVEQVLEVRMA